MKKKKFKSLDEARLAYLSGGISAEQFARYLKEFAIGDTTRKNSEKKLKQIERKLKVV